MTGPLFDRPALEQRRRRALATGPRLFLVERALEDLAERLAMVRRSFERPLIIGVPDVALAGPLGFGTSLRSAPDLDAIAAIEPGTVDLLVILGQLDTAEDPPGVLQVLRHWLAPGALLAGVVPGGDSLPVLRAALLEADRLTGSGAAPRTHPRLEASAVAGLLGSSGFVEPVVDIDRVQLRYRLLDDLVADLRGMGATNVLTQRSRRPLTRAQLECARQAFAAEGDQRGTVETVELIHFAAWTPGK
jgi:NADH dehydrogenase [ubiquinone] 1 alpha subcomplex assembly factor 5